QMITPRSPTLLLFFLISAINAVKVIQNGLAPPEVVHTPISLKPRCIVHAAPLDLIFVLDSSGSLRNQFQDEVDVIRRIIKHVTIGKDATRVMLVQFSGIQHLEFGMLKFTSRDELLGALDVLRHVSGITRIGGAFEFTRLHMTAANGVRDSSVPKVLYLLSDGRTHDYPKDNEQIEVLRRQIPNLDIFAYGTGEYVAMPALLNYTQSAKKIVTSKNLNDLEPMFNPWKGTEICDKVPVCIKGSDKPVDLALVIDASESLDRLFDAQIKFAIERVIQNVNVHYQAAKIALVSYSGQVFTHFTFNNRFTNNSMIIRQINNLRSIKGVTSTDLALKETLALFTTKAEQSGARPDASKLVVVLTDGHSARMPGKAAAAIRDAGISVIAVSVAGRPYVDERELLSIAGSPERVFTPTNLQEFEHEFFKYVGFGCPGAELGKDAKPTIRGATDVSCDASSLTFTVRTQKPMKGMMYAQKYQDSQECVLHTDGSDREVTIKFQAGSCGLERIPSANGKGYSYNISVILQFHPLIMTRADTGLDVSCFYSAPVAPSEIGRSTIKKLSETQCTYRLHKYAASHCVALDARVGESLFHKWQCDNAPNYQYLVHDCFVRSENHHVQFIDGNGCQMDDVILETPNYSKLLSRGKSGELFVSQEMSAFKFPGDNNLVFSCSISLCDMEGDDTCTQMIPPKCSNATGHPLIDTRNGLRRLKRALPTTKPGFAMTLHVETRTLNVVESESMNPKDAIRYCAIH
ncbi:hypothetical protein PFISCL1PPCAC_9913, partial [Pristionchus fissidentatus]